MAPDVLDEGGLRGLISGKGGRVVLPAMGLAGAALLAQAGGAVGRLVAPQDGGAGLLVFLLVIVGIVAAIYVVWNTILAWIASHILALPEATLGRALKFTIMTAVVGVCMTVAFWVVVAGLLGLTFRGVLGENAEGFPATAAIAILAFFALWLLIAIVVAGWVYRIGFLRAFLFLIVLWIVNVAAGVGLRAAGCVSTSSLPADLPGFEHPSPANETT